MTFTTEAGAPSSLGERFAARMRNLSPAEIPVARFFDEHREEAAFESAAEIGGRLGTSDATVIRTAQKLGYSGLSDLKRELIEQMRVRLTPAFRLGRSLDWVGQTPHDILVHVIDLEIELLEEARRSTDANQFARAVDLIVNAQRVAAFGIGPLAALAQHLGLRLTRFGFNAITITHSGFRLADDLIVLRPNDVLVLVAYGGLYREPQVALEYAIELGIPVVLVTDTLLSEAAGQATAVIAARCRHGGMMNTIVPTMMLLEALVFSIASRRRPESLASMRELNMLRARVTGEEANRHQTDPDPLD